MSTTVAVQTHEEEHLRLVINTIPSTGIVFNEANVAARVIKALPTTVAAPLEVTRQKINTASSCPKVKWVFVAWAMKSAPMVR